MGVYIPKMKKPKCCGVCLLCLDDSRIANGYCMIFHRHVNMAELDEKCPLIEVTEPHGRLIDADKQHKRLQKQVMALYSEKSDKYSYLMDVLYSIHGEPTIIEAEGE